MRNNAKWDKRDNKDIRQTANSNQEVLTMTRYDERYDEFGYEREDYDGTVQLNEYLTPREVMELLAIGKNTFYKMVQSGALPAFRVGKQWRVKRAVLEQLFRFCKF